MVYSPVRLHRSPDAIFIGIIFDILFVVSSVKYVIKFTETQRPLH